MTSTRVGRIPGSKSRTNRLLLLAAAADGPSVLHRPLHSDDTVAFADALCDLGVPVQRDEDRWTVRGIGRGRDGHGQRTWCHDAGTAAQFLPPSRRPASARSSSTALISCAAVFFPETIQPLAYAAVAVIGSVAGSGLGVLALAVRRS